jgi:hypothetical protein
MYAKYCILDPLICYCQSFSCIIIWYFGLVSCFVVFYRLQKENCRFYVEVADFGWIVQTLLRAIECRSLQSSAAVLERKGNHDRVQMRSSLGQP